MMSNYIDTNIPDSFKDNIRTILILNREKNIQERKCIRKISTGINQYNKIVCELTDTNEFKSGEYRIYSSVNTINLQKSVKEFKRRQLDIDYEQYEQRLDWYTHLDYMFFSCVSAPSSRESKYFLYDCDTDEEYKNTIEALKDEVILLDYATKNGRHIVTEPHNPHKTATLIKDALLLVRYIP